MVFCKKEITQEQYERAVENRGKLTKADYEEIFSASERFGYGIYLPVVYKDGEKYMASYHRGETCD